MFNFARLFLATIVVSSALVACGDNNTTSPETTSTPATAVATVSPAKVEAGMTEEAATELLGEASFSQTNAIDELTITHTEWTTDAGTTSVQFHNGKAVYSQFVASPAE